jgi:polyisoprenoid-binding protein YceI
MKQLLTLTLTGAIILSVGLLSGTFANDTNEKEENTKAMQWMVDRSHSELAFTVRHFFTPVRGIFEDYEAEIYFDPENLENSSIYVKVNVASINTRNTRRDDHLRSDDFFDVDVWPQMQFKSEQIEARDGKFVAIGELTIRDVTVAYELPFELLGVMDHPRRENTLIAGITSATSLNRNDFGVGTGSWGETAVVGGTVNIEILLELTARN